MEQNGESKSPGERYAHYILDRIADSTKEFLTSGLFEMSEITDGTRLIIKRLEAAIRLDEAVNNGDADEALRIMEAEKGPVPPEMAERVRTVLANAIGERGHEDEVPSLSDVTEAHTGQYL